MPDTPGLHLGPDSAPRARMDWAAEKAREQARVDAACPPERAAEFKVYVESLDAARRRWPDRSRSIAAQEPRE